VADDAREDDDGDLVAAKRLDRLNLASSCITKDLLRKLLVLVEVVRWANEDHDDDDNDDDDDDDDGTKEKAEEKAALFDVDRSARQ